MRKLFIVLLLVLFSFMSCSPDSPNSEQTLMVPTFIKPGVSINNRSWNLSQDKLYGLMTEQDFLYYTYAPVLSNFERKDISFVDSYEISICGETFPLTYREEDGRNVFIGKTDDDGIYINIIYYPESKTFDYTQVLNIEIDNKQSSEKENTIAFKHRINIVHGKNIEIDDNGKIHGEVRCYFINQDENESGSPIEVSKMEFFSNDLISGIIYQQGMSSEEETTDIKLSLEFVDEIIELGNAFYESHSEDFKEEYAIWYFDKIKNEIAYYGINELGVFVDDDGTVINKERDLAEIKEKALDLSKGEWEIII